MNIMLYSKDTLEKNRIFSCLTQCGCFNIIAFNSENECITYLKNNAPEMIVITIDEYGNSHRRILDLIKKNSLRSPICLIGNKETQACDAYRYKCDLFVLSENLENDIQERISDLILLSRRVKRIKIVTFGCFDIFVDGKKVHFKSSKAKELIAVCVDKCGFSVSAEEAADILWPNRPYDTQVKNLYRKAVMTIKNVFRSLDINDFFITGRGWCCIDKEAVDCDYYNFLDSPKLYSSIFNGEYMFDYSWAEITLAHLLNINNKNK